MQKMENLKYLLGLYFFFDWRGSSIEEINKNWGMLRLLLHKVTNLQTSTGCL